MAWEYTRVRGWVEVGDPLTYDDTLIGGNRYLDALAKAGFFRKDRGITADGSLLTITWDTSENNKFPYRFRVTIELWDVCTVYVPDYPDLYALLKEFSTLFDMARNAVGVELLA